MIREVLARSYTTKSAITEIRRAMEDLGNSGLAKERLVSGMALINRLIEEDLDFIENVLDKLPEIEDRPNSGGVKPVQIRTG